MNKIKNTHYVRLTPKQEQRLANLYSQLDSFRTEDISCEDDQNIENDETRVAEAGAND